VSREMGGVTIGSSSVTVMYQQTSLEYAHIASSDNTERMVSLPCLLINRSVGSRRHILNLLLKRLLDECFDSIRVEA
jgi:hypothetical protein